MAGNVVEWCNEISNDDKESTQNTSPSPVLRGGAWNFDPVSARAAYRDGFNPDYRDNYIGFRLLRSPPS
jgi:formylglycine-generating enzyme required for sulfatase activity